MIETENNIIQDEHDDLQKSFVGIGQNALEKTFARENGYQRLGNSEVEVFVPLTSEEKIFFGSEQTAFLDQIDQLAKELDAIKSNYKVRVKKIQAQLKQVTKYIRESQKPCVKSFPCFLDAQKGQKHWVDFETGEVVKSIRADNDDFQVKLYE